MILLLFFFRNTTVLWTERKLLFSSALVFNLSIFHGLFWDLIGGKILRWKYNTNNDNNESKWLSWVVKMPFRKTRTHLINPWVHLTGQNDARECVLNIPNKCWMGISLLEWSRWHEIQAYIKSAFSGYVTHSTENHCKVKTYIGV